MSKEGEKKLGNTRGGVPTLASPEALVVFHLAQVPSLSSAGVSSLAHVPTAEDAKVEEWAAVWKAEP